MGSSDNKDIIRKYFDDEEWFSMSDYEKEAKVKQRENYEALVDLGLNPKMPFYMEKYEANAKKVAEKLKQSSKLTNDDHLFKKPLPPKRLRLRRDVENIEVDNTSRHDSTVPSIVKVDQQFCEGMDTIESMGLAPEASDGSENNLRKLENFLKDPKSKWTVMNSNRFQQEDSQNSPSTISKSEKLILDDGQNRSLSDEEISEMMQHVGDFKWFLEDTTDSTKQVKPLTASSSVTPAAEDEKLPGKRYPRRSVTVKNYTEPEIPDADMFIYCDFCENVHEGLCPRHKEVVHVKDTEIPKDKKDEFRALKTTPPGLTVIFSSIPAAGDGVWSTEKIKKGTVFGPYDGVFRKNVEIASNDYSWEIKKDKKPIGFIDGKDMTQSNWMRFVNCARSTSEQNLIAYQYNGQIYYRSFEDIPPNRELFVYYGEKFGKQLGIADFNAPKTLSQSVFTCPHCATGFSSPFYVKRHSKYCRKALRAVGESKDILSSSPKIHCSFKVCVICRKNVILSSKTAPSSKPNCENCIIPPDNGVIIRAAEITRSREKKLMKTQQTVYYKSEICSSTTSSIYSEEKPYACTHPECSARFTRSGHLSTHMKTHTGEKPYACTHPECSARFIWSGDLNKHMKTHTGKKPYACTHPECSARFSQSSNLSRHMKTHTGEKPYACTHPECSARFSQSSSLSTHMKTHTGEKPYACTHPDCSARFSQSSTLSTHMKTHTGEKPYACTHPECSARFSRSSSLSTHMKTHTGEKPYACTHPECSARFSRSSSLSTHMKTHTGEKPYACTHPECSARFSQSSSLSTHMKTHTGEKPYACTHPECSARFISSGDLNKHMKTHTGEKPYACTHPECSARFIWSGDLNKHMKTHTGEKPYACTHPECSARFSQSSNLSTHMKTHTGEKPYACTHPECSARFSQSSSLSTHMKTHTGEKPYACTHPECSARFIWSGDLNKHMKTHTGEKPYACTHPECSARFSQSSNLSRHMKTHTGEKPYACTHPECSARLTGSGRLSQHMKTQTGEKPFA